MEELENTFKPSPNVSANVVASNKNAVDNSKCSENGSQISYFCRVCKLGLTSSDVLNNHLHSFHVIKRNRDCFSCGCHPCAEIFQTSALLTDHLRREHTEQKFYSCCRCGKKFAHSYSVPTHYSSDPPSKIYCNMCIIELKNVKDEVVKITLNDENTLKLVPNVPLNTIRNDINNVDQSKSVWNDGAMKSSICQICQLGFSSSIALDDHLRSYHVVACFSCGSCKEEFETLEMLMNHLRIDHTEQKINICSQCGQKLTCTLSVPINRTSGPRKIYCDHCMMEPDNENNYVTEVMNEKYLKENSSETVDDLDNMTSCDSDADGLNCASSNGETDNHLCQICQQRLSSNNLDGHILCLHAVKSGRGRFSCVSCTKVFKSLTLLIIHLRRDHTLQMIYSCGQCGKKLTHCHFVTTHDTEKEASHIYCSLCAMKHENTKKKNLEVCKENICGQDEDIHFDKSIDMPSEIVDQVVDQAKELSACDIINEKDNTITTLNNLKHKKRKFACDICSKRFWKRVTLLNHERKHCGENQHSCENCGKNYSSAANLRRHLLTHSGEKPYHCDTCGKAFTQKKSLSLHQRRRHTGEKPYVCDICQRGFPLKDMMETHKRLHTGERPFHCRICDKKYNSRTALKEHYRKHDNRKFACDVCLKEYSNRGGLFNHKRIHTGEKPYSCEFCEKRFSNSNSRRVHMKIHSQEKPFMCDACGKRFTQKPHLKSHLRVHTGEKPYECDICRQAFSHKSSMVAHRRIHTGERPFQCDICQKKFVEKGQLRKHQRTHDRD